MTSPAVARTTPEDSLADPSIGAADARALHRVAEGDVLALRELYGRHGGRVFGFCRRMLGDSREVEEATQDVFVRVWRRAATYDARLASPWAWIAMMARSVCLDRLRRRRARPDLLAGVMYPIEDLDSSDRTELLSATAVIDADNLLQFLRPAERDCITHIVLGGLSHVETSRRTGLPLGTVKTHMRRGLERLRKLLSHHES